MNKKIALIFMVVVVIGLTFITSTSLLTGCAGQVPSATNYDQTSTFTKTPTLTSTSTPTNTATP